MAREIQASGTNVLGPNYTYTVSKVSNQIVVVLSEAGDTITFRFDNRDQAHEVLRDIILQVNSLA